MGSRREVTLGPGPEVDVSEIQWLGVGPKHFLSLGLDQFSFFFFRFFWFF